MNKSFEIPAHLEDTFDDMMNRYHQLSPEEVEYLDSLWREMVMECTGLTPDEIDKLHNEQINKN